LAVFGGPIWIVAPLGGFVLLFAPGYAMSAAIFGRHSRQPWSVLFVASVGFSVVANGLVGLLFLIQRVGLPAGFLAFINLGIVLVSLEIFFVRERTLTSPVGGSPRTRYVAASQTGWRKLVAAPGFSSSQKVVAAVLVASAVVLLGLTIALSAQHPSEVPTVSLGISGPGGNSSSLPLSGSVGQALTVVISAASNSTYPQLVFLTQSYLSAGPPPPNFTEVAWNSTLHLAAGVESNKTLSFSSNSIQTFDVNFTFAQRGNYVVRFSLESLTGTPLRIVLAPVTIR
jgi:uncharacterized membrane protein